MWVTKNNHQGFTVVEVIIVIVVIAILAVITVFGYGSWRLTVADRQVKSDLNGVIAGMESKRNFNDGYPVFSEGTTFDASNPVFESSEGVTLTYVKGDKDSYCIQATSQRSEAIRFFINSANGNKSVQPGSCPIGVNDGVVTTIISGGLNYPTGIAVDSSNNLYVAETGNNRILKITPAGVTSVLAGGTRGYLDGTGAAARFDTPYGVAVDSATGNVYVADHDNERIRMITPAGVVSTFAGSTPGDFDATGTAARFDDPYAVIIDPSNGNLYVSESYNHQIRQITTPGQVVTTVAGATVGYLDATGTAARFHDPVGLAIHDDNSIYVVEWGNDKIRKITIPGKVVTTRAGSTTGFADGVGSDARFNNPTGIGIRNNIAYIADSDNNRVRMVNINTGEVLTLAGSGVQGDLDGVGLDAEFNNPTGIAVGLDEVIYIVESGTGQIRKIQ